MTTTNEQLAKQVSQLTDQYPESQAHSIPGTATKFNLSAMDIITIFEKIKPFSGEDDYKLKTFLQAVSNAEVLCGTATGLRLYCLGLVISTKIIGEASNIIAEIAEHSRDWASVVETLKLRYRPKYTVHLPLSQGREIKVNNLKDLFKALFKVKADAYEVCEYNQMTQLTYSAINSELLEILRSKIVPTSQLHIDMTKSLIENHNELCQTELYECEEIIKPEFRESKNTYVKHFQNKSNFRNHSIQNNIPYRNQCYNPHYNLN